MIKNFSLAILFVSNLSVASAVESSTFMKYQSSHGNNQSAQVKSPSNKQDKYLQQAMAKQNQILNDLLDVFSNKNKQYKNPDNNLLYQVSYQYVPGKFRQDDPRLLSKKAAESMSQRDQESLLLEMLDPQNRDKVVLSEGAYARYGNKMYAYDLRYQNSQHSFRIQFTIAEK